MFGTTTLQPYAEYGWRALPNLTVTPGMKYAYYKQDFTQFADNGKTVGNLNGAPSVNHVAEYHSWLPSIDAHILVQPDWSVYGQYGKGQNIPPIERLRREERAGRQRCRSRSSPTRCRSDRSGSRAARRSIVDFYHINFQSDYSSTIDAVTGDTLYFLNGESITQGIEAESTILVGRGVAVYLNATKGTAKYTDSGPLGAERAERHRDDRPHLQPGRTGTSGCSASASARCTTTTATVHQAIPIDPFNITNLFFNYTLRGSSRLSQSRVRLAVNNLTDSHAITGGRARPRRSRTPPAPGDILTLMSGRSVSVSLTVGFSPR